MNRLKVLTGTVPMIPLAHEIGHTLGLTDSYGHGNGHGEGIMGSPPTTLLPSEVDKIWEKAYERKK